MNAILPHLVVCICALASTVSAQITVFAASSMTEAIKEIGACFTENSGETVRFNFASSGTLARQIEAGAPVDVFISANIKWMDHLEQKSAILKGSRFNLAVNSLVLVVPHNAEGIDSLRNSAFLVQDFAVPSGRIAVGEFNSVPAGIYAKEALEHMDWLDALKPNLLMGANARTALMYVERGEAAAGIVYATDARASDKVVVVGTFPAESHSPIIYPAAACSGNPETTAFMAFLQSEEAKSILEKHGFE